MITSRTLNIEGDGYIVALGTFDGVHIGHEGVIKAALSSGLPVAVVTSDINPKVAFGGKVGKISSEAICNEQFARLGVSAVIRLDFNSIRNFTPIEYLDMLCDLLGARGFACGYDFRFGKGACGASETLADYAKAHGLLSFVCDEVDADDEAVSSSRIRRLLEDGDIVGANRLLGRYYAIDFPVIHGDARGRKLGFATANQAYGEGYTLPRRGVYATRVTCDGVVYPAVTNIGTRPTFCDGAVVAETHVIGETLDLYNKNIKVEFLAFLRDEIKFASADELIVQVEKDKLSSLKYEY